MNNQIGQNISIATTMSMSAVDSHVQILVLYREIFITYKLILQIYTVVALPEVPYDSSEVSQMIEKDRKSLRLILVLAYSLWKTVHVGFPFVFNMARHTGSAGAFSH